MDEKIKQKIIKAVTNKEKPLKETAASLYMTERQLGLLLDAWGVQLPRRKRHNRVPRPERDAIMSLYKKYGNTAKLAEYLNVGINTVNRWMRELNIPTRKMKMEKDEKIRFLEEHLNRLDDVRF